MAIPYTVIGGFLGAGKTTLLNRILREAAGIRYAVLVNDFGALNIDAELIEAHGGETVALANGCICCSIGDSLVETLVALMGRGDVADHILVEASGVADPARIADVAVIDPALRLDGTIVLADMAALADQVRDRYVGETVRRQLQSADLLVCNKLDLATSRQLAAARAVIADAAPDVPVIETARAELPLDAVLGQAGVRPAVSHGHEHGGHDDIFRRTAVVGDTPLSRAEFEAALDDLPASVLRGKGFVRFAEAPADTHLLHLVGRRWSLTKTDPRDGPACQLVFVGTARMPEVGLLET